MRRVAQRVGTDCGVAAVAIIADVTYEEAREAFTRFRGRGFGTHAKDVRRALGQLSVRLGKKLRKARRSKPLDLPFDALVLVTLARKPEAWGDHWIVWDSDGQRLIDPYRKTPRPWYRVEGYYRINPPK